jgi:hypothetical protein
LPEVINPGDFELVTVTQTKPILGDDFVLFPRPVINDEPVPLEVKWKRRSSNKK